MSFQFSQTQKLKFIFISRLPVKRGQAPNTSQPGESAAQLCSSGWCTQTWYGITLLSYWVLHLQMWQKRRTFFFSKTETLKTKEQSDDKPKIFSLGTIKGQERKQMQKKRKYSEHQMNIYVIFGSANTDQSLQKTPIPVQPVIPVIQSSVSTASV